MDASENAALRTVRLHRLIFRLHFYAGLIVAPFVLILAITGAIYLFVTEIEDFAHPAWRFTQAQGQHLPPERLANGALTAFPGAKPTRIDLPTAPSRTAIVYLTPKIGEPFRVYVDPVSGKALGSFIYARTLVGWADQMHGTLLMGDGGDLVVETASCWAILLVLTGLYLWWPRTPNRIMGVFIPRLDLKGRAFWRDVHAVGGVWTSGLILFLLLSGLPWATNWGGTLERALVGTGLGYPPAYRTHIGGHGATPGLQTKEILAQTNKGVPWTIESAPAPHSHAGHAMAAIDVGAAGRIFAGAGLSTAYRLIYPRNEHDVFTAYTYPDQPEGQRTIHLDQYSGQIVNDVSFKDYGAVAKTIEWGVALHMGNYFGVANLIAMLIAALGAAALAISGPLMWMARRKKGLGAPTPLPSSGIVWGVAVFVGVLGLAFPMLGVTALAVLALERLVLARIPVVARWLGLCAGREAQRA